jgi:hypothetical protein
LRSVRPQFTLMAFDALALLLKTRPIDVREENAA